MQEARRAELLERASAFAGSENFERALSEGAMLRFSDAVREALARCNA
ncbi:MAG: hypothetical protein ACRDJI_02660 [Actinomycetota bacterium]